MVTSVLLGAGRVLAAPGDVHPFNADANDTVFGLAALPSGLVLIGGDFTTINGGIPRSGLARLNPVTGALDGSYTATANGSVRTLNVQPDGKVVIAGFFSSVNGTTRNRVARLHADGTLDTGFNPNANDLAFAHLQPDGKVLLGGFFTTLQPNGAPSPTTRNYVARVNADGSLDAAFNPNAGFYVYHATVQPDGRILLGGAFTTLQPNGAPSPTTRRHAARLNADGSIDPSFVDPNINDNVIGLAVQPDGRVLICGSFTSVGGQPRNYIARLNSDGTLDTSFNPNASARVDSLGLQVDGRIIVTGDFTTIGGGSRTRLARLLPDGTLDPSFFASANALALGTVALDDSSVILGGQFTQLNGTANRNRIARLLNDAGTSYLNVTSANRVVLERGGSQPETSSVTFELSTDSGTTYVPLGQGLRLPNGHWELTGLSLPFEGTVRARARIRGGHGNSSLSQMESLNGYTNLPIPRIAVSGQGHYIAPGDSTPTPTDGTDFGSVSSYGGSVTRTFTIANGGEATMHLGTVSVTAGVGFSIVTQPASTLAAGASTTFQVRFLPGSGGPLSATVSIPSDVYGQSTYPFAVQGLATQIEAAFAPNFSGGSVAAVAELSDHRLEIVGSFGTVNGQGRAGLVRIFANGTLDGSLNYNSPQNFTSASFLALQFDHSSAVGPRLVVNSGVGRDFGRLGVNGGVAEAGAARVNFNTKALAIQRDGRELVVGDFTTVTQWDNPLPVARNRLVRFDLNLVNIDYTLFNSGDLNGSVNCVALQDDGQMLIGGTFPTVQSFATSRLARLSANGVIDLTFQVSVTGNSVECIYPLPDGRLLVGGDFTMINGVPAQRLARLQANGAVDPTFSATFDGTVRQLAPQADGRVFVRGSFANVNGVAVTGSAVRLNADGSLDRSFASGYVGTLLHLSLQDDGRILLGGSNGLVRMENEPATSTLAVTSTSRMVWLRGGSAPELTQVRFEFSSNGGASFNEFGTVHPIPGGWELTGQNLPTSGTVRARGRIGGRSEGIASQVLNYTVPAATVQVVAAGGVVYHGEPASAAKGTEFQPATPGGAAIANFNVFASGGADVQISNLAVSGPQAAEFTVVLQPPTSLPAGSQGLATVLFQPTAQGLRRARISFTHNGTAESPYTFEIQGFGSIVEPLFAHDTLGAVLCLLPNAESLVLAGSFSQVESAPRANLASLNTAGSLDAGFNPGSNGTIYTSAYLPDPLFNPAAKILVGGFFDQLGGQSHPGVGRLLPTGTVESGFTTAAIGGGVVTLLPRFDGSLFLGGFFTNVAGSSRLGLAKLNPDGSLNALDYGLAGGAQVFCFAPLASGKILVGGRFAVLGLGYVNLIRLNADGTIDPSFAPNPNDGVYAMVEQADGKILIGGNFTALVGGTRLRLARLNADGSLDASVQTPFDGEIRSLGLQTDGLILPAGEFRTVGNTPRPYLARLLSDGTLDSSFDVAPSGSCYPALREDGRILVGGSQTQIGGRNRTGLARLTNGPASYSYSVTPNRIAFLRGGSAPETGDVEFALDTGGGATVFVPQARPTRMAGGWELTGLNLPKYGTVRVRARIGGAIFNGSTSVTQEFVSFNFLTPIEQWRLDFLGDYQNTGVAANDYDFDGDGVPNLLEFAFGMNPAGPDLELLPMLQRSGGNVFYSFPTPIGVGGITYSAEWASDLTGTWTSIPDTGIPPQHLFTLPENAAPRLFLRLRVSEP